jgi:hypothetical protein
MTPETVGALGKLHAGPAAFVQVAFVCSRKIGKFYGKSRVFESEAMLSRELRPSCFAHCRLETL